MEQQRPGPGRRLWVGTFSANNSSDPRHGTVANAECNAAAGGAISMPPGSLGMAATFDPMLVAKNLAKSPPPNTAHWASPPRFRPKWTLPLNRAGTVSAVLSAKILTWLRIWLVRIVMVSETSTGTQEIANGWGYGSVNAMVEHWPGGGSGEAGRDAHFGMGKFAVYPGDQFQTHFIPFINGAFKLKGKTMMASAVMP